jgi:hypothetical protein
MAPPSVPAAVVIPPASPALRAAIRQLAKAHGILIGAQADNEEAQAIADDWEKQNPMPASRRGRKRWWKKATAYREALVSKPWQELLKADADFATAQATVATSPIASAADPRAMASASVIYDRVEVIRNNRAPIAVAVTHEFFRLGLAVQS